MLLQAIKDGVTPTTRTTRSGKTPTKKRKVEKKKSKSKKLILDGEEDGEVCPKFVFAISEM